MKRSAIAARSVSDSIWATTEATDDFWYGIVTAEDADVVDDSLPKCSSHSLVSAPEVSGRS